LTFDSNGVITGASNNAVSVANTAITGNIISSQITSVANTQISGNITAAQITSVANTQLTGLIQAAQIGSANATLITSGTLPGARLPVGSVLQVVQAFKTDTWSEAQSSNSISGSNVTGLTATITPTSSSSKILVFVTLNLNSSTSGGGVGAGFALYRAGSKIASGDASGSAPRTSLTAAGYIGTIQELLPMSMNYLDSPATTSSTAYSIRLWNGAGSTATMYVNRVDQDTDAVYAPRSVSSVTLMEIAA
jgi:hypothetical protein